MDTLVTGNNFVFFVLNCVLNGGDVGVQIYQSTLDRWTPHLRCRWSGTLVLLLGFAIRIIAKQVLILLCCSSGTKEWWTGQYHGKKFDGSLPSCSSLAFWPECFTHRYFYLLVYFKSVRWRHS